MQHIATAIECLSYLIRDTEKAMDFFFKLPDSYKFFSPFIRRVIDDNFEKCEEAFEELMRLMHVMCGRDLAKTYDLVFKKISFVKLVSPIMLRSDNLGLEAKDTSEEEKRKADERKRPRIKCV